MLDIILDNPYRVLGVYSNSPKKELVANLSKINAFLKVGKLVSFPMDMPSLLNGLVRTEEMVADANSKLALPADQFRYAQFWFVKATTFDEIALNNLIAGDVEKAMSIWEKREDATSLQNRIVCNLISDNVSEAITCAERLYTSFKNDFVKTILGDNPPIGTKNVEYDFLDKLCEEIGVNGILPYVSSEDWKQYVSGQAVKPLVAGLMNAVSVAKQSKGNGPEARYNAGTKLMNDTKAPLKQLKSLTGETDLQYQMVADKVGLEILQCGIDYYNKTKTYDAPKNAMKLMAYALSIVVGQMAKERCEENVNIVQKAVDSMLPEVVSAEAEAIEQELQKFYKLPELICHSITLLNNTKPYLQSIREKLGGKDESYLRISTKVVECAMYNVIKEVNSIPKYADFKSPWNKQIIQNALNAFTIMKSFGKEEPFKERYDENRVTLNRFCERSGVTHDTLNERVRKRRNRIAFWTIMPIVTAVTLYLCFTISWWFALAGFWVFTLVFCLCFEE